MLWIGIFLLLKARALLGHESPAQRGCHGNWFIYLWCSKNWSGPTPRLERFNVTIDILLAGLASKLVRGKRIYWSPTKQGQTRAGICSPGKTWHTIVDQAYDGQHYRVHQVEDKVEPIVYLGLDEGAGVDDLHIVGWCTTRVLTFPFTPPPSGQTRESKSPCLPLQCCPSFYFILNWSSELWKLLEENEAWFQKLSKN